MNGSYDVLQFDGPERRGDCDVWTAHNDGQSDPSRQVFSCVAVYRGKWIDGVPALGGTRRLPNDDHRAADLQGCRRDGTLDDVAREAVLSEAVGLAEAMFVKNTLLRKAAERWKESGGGTTVSYGWQGGKGVIWAPLGDDAAMEEHRLRCHGRLIDHMNGLYFGSKDQRVAERHLRLIASETEHVVGLQCRRDTGEATSLGVVSGLLEASRRLGLGKEAERPLAGLSVLVVGLGKVGLPLLLGLRQEGVEVAGLDSAKNLQSGSEAGVRRHFDTNVSDGAAVDRRHLDLLLELWGRGRLFTSEDEAMRWGDFQVLSPNGGNIEWLVEQREGLSRAERLAEVAKQRGKLRLVLGAGNDQVPLSSSRSDAREAALSTLAEAGVWFVPDPLVSPGGVIAVSHEPVSLAALKSPVAGSRWERLRVNHDAWEIVRVAVEWFFERYGKLAGEGSLEAPDGGRIWQTFESLVADSG